jgi:excisionase family DNA binding protein
VAKHQRTGPLGEPLLTVDELRVLLRVSRSTLYELVRSGELRPIRVGERLRFEPDAVREYLDREREDGGS